MNDKQFFFEACYSANLKNFYLADLKQHPNHFQQYNVSAIYTLAEFLSIADSSLIGHNKFSPSSTCRKCNKHVEKEDFSIGYAYWNAVWYNYHKDCRQEGMKQEAFDCQKIDADCNDCAYFVREKTEKDIAFGQCKKHSQETVAFSNLCSGYSCFEHRKFGEHGQAG